MREIIATLLFFWVFINFIAVFHGVLGAGRESCQHWSRIEIIFPGMHLGCWLLQPLELEKK